MNIEAMANLVKEAAYNKRNESGPVVIPQFLEENDIQVSQEELLQIVDILKLEGLTVQSFKGIEFRVYWPPGLQP